MDSSYLSPVQDLVLAQNALMSNQALGKKIKIHSAQNGIPDLKDVKIAIIGVLEGRGAVDNNGTGTTLNELRKELYKLYPGNWPINVADLGDIQQGNTIEDINKNLKKFIQQEGFNINFEKCINDKEIEDFVLNDRIEGVKNFKINATPTIIINNKKFEKSLNYKNLKKSLEKLI